MNILLTGANGFVGSGLKRAFPEMIAAPSLRQISEEEITRLADAYDVIIHTAAISDIGTCEKDPDASYRANVLLPVYLARACNGARKLICFSSDQVYSGCDEEGPYDENTAKPANTYAVHKLEMEQRVLDICPDAVMLRAEWMYDYHTSRPNYLSLVMKAEQLAFSSKQYRGVTWLQEVAETMPAVMKLPGGVYNFGSETNKSIYEITRDFVKVIGRQTTVEDAPPQHNLWMNCGKAKRHGVNFSTVEDALKRCAMEYGLSMR